MLDERKAALGWNVNHAFARAKENHFAAQRGKQTPTVVDESWQIGDLGDDDCEVWRVVSPSAAAQVVSRRLGR